LAKKLMRYIRQYNKNPKPVKWKYSNPGRRIKRESSVSVHLGSPARHCIKQGNVCSLVFASITPCDPRHYFTGTTRRPFF
jgi:hypothetical protein